MPFPNDVLGTYQPVTNDEAEFIVKVKEWCEDRGVVVTQKHQPFAGQIGSVQIDVLGESAAECESTLLEYATRCDLASQASEVAYGKCVIQRNLEEKWGATYSWKGRLTIFPTIGTAENSERAKKALRDSDAPLVVRTSEEFAAAIRQRDA